MDSRDTVLIVDDEENVVSSLRRLLRHENYQIATASNPEDALQILSTTPAQLVISDNSMPGMSGSEFLEHVRERWPDTIRIMLTGYASTEATMDAINRGEVYRFVTKPWDPLALRLMVKQGLDQHHLVQENRRMQAMIQEQNRDLARWNEKLQERVDQSTQEIRESKAQLEELYHQLKASFVGTLDAFAAAMEVRDPYTAGHQRRVGSLSEAIAREMGLAQEQVNAVQLAAAVHDIGKIAVPSEILNRPGRLSDLEFSLIKTHPEVAYDILKNVEFPWPIATVVRQHHEKMDGSGYPQGLTGDEILLEARILAVSDVMEAMASHRPYRPALGLQVAVREIQSNAGVLYDRDVVDALMRLIENPEHPLAGILPS